MIRSPYEAGAALPEPCRALGGRIEAVPVRTSDAFPEGIPDPILSDRMAHTTPYPGDWGIRFEEDAERAAYLRGESPARSAV
jgi:hypothetical protein